MVTYYQSNHKRLAGSGTVPSYINISKLKVKLS